MQSVWMYLTVWKAEGEAVIRSCEGTKWSAVYKKFPEMCCVKFVHVASALRSAKTNDSATVRQENVCVKR